MLKIVSWDIIENAQKFDAEAIVNPNNKYMDYGCGVCGASIGYNHDDVAEIVMNLLIEFCNNNSNIEIIFNLYDKNTEEIYKRYC